MSTGRDTERLQQDHFDSIAADYERHYGDAYSRAYRDKFIYEPMFAGIDLQGKQALDAMCGGGETTEFILARGAEVTGLDLSDRMLDAFRERYPTCETVHASISETGFADEAFDCVAVVGGLHHLHPHMDDAIVEIHRVLKGGGHFCFMEPHTGSLPDVVRRVWYRNDALFESNEEAVDLGHIRSAHAKRFRFRRTNFVGNLAYLFVLNSMIFRVPHGLKKYYAPLLMKVEDALARMQNKSLSCIAVCQVEKR